MGYENVANDKERRRKRFERKRKNEIRNILR